MDPKAYLDKPIGNEKELRGYFKNNQKLIIFDIGSCDGLDSIRYHRIFPNAKIFLFEPLEKNMEEVHRNLAAFNASNIKCYNFAFSDSNDIQPFYVSSGNPSGLKNELWDYGNKSSSLLPPGKHMKEYYPWLKFEEVIEVPCRKLDDFVKEIGISKIDFLHIDVQGAEREVLLGGSNTLEFAKVLWLEVENLELYKGQALKGDIESLLLEKGFTLIKEQSEGISGDQLWANLGYFPRKRITRFLWLLWYKWLK